MVFPTPHTVVYQLRNRVTLTNEPISVGAELHLNLTQALMTNCHVMVQNELGNVSFLEE